MVYGYMPAKTTIFNTRAVALHSMPLGPRNTILFSPRGRFVIVAGFGNLAGQMDIYDLEKDYRKICTIEASNPSVCEWSPDERFIMTATTSPRLRVDNGVRIWHVTGGLMYTEDMQELYHVTWRPQSGSNLPGADPLNPVPPPHASALSYLGTVKTPSKPAGAYRPPGARGTVTPLAFKREDEGGAAYVSSGAIPFGGANGFGKPRRREVPGAEAAEESVLGAAPTEGDENLSKAALKNKKKREAKKAKDAADKAAGLAPSGDAPAAVPIPSRSPERRDHRGHERHRSHDMRPRSQTGRSPRASSQRRREYAPAPNGVENITNGHPHSHAHPHHQNSSHRSPKPSTPNPNSQKSPPPIQTTSTPTPSQSQSSSSTPAQPPDLKVTSPGSGGTPQEKKIRALTKKLRAIDDLKMRRAGGEQLEGTQIKKMETEEGIRRELEGLGWFDGY